MDGLRAFAILPVVLFHAGLGMPGGFTGVDVFFVISGFLITGIIEAELDDGRFTLSKFWERRARRILPMLMATIAASLVAALFLLVPWDLNRLANQSLGALASVSNFQFAQSVGYWEPQSNTVALLHTWSLAVEEQFYLFVPGLMLLLHRKVPSKKLLVISALLFLSLGFTLFSNRQSPYHFYMLPFRAWEMLLGAVAIMLVRRGHRLPGLLDRWGSWIGIGMILQGALFIHETPEWPNYNALIPTVGTFLILMHGATAPRENTVLSLPPVRFVGLISYSLYLWHWPVLVFFNEFFYPDPLQSRHRFLAIIVSILLSCVSWRFIEQPFRNRESIPTRSFLPACAICWLALIAACFLVKRSKGMEARFTRSIPAEGRILLTKGQLPERYDATSKLAEGGLRFGPTDVPPRWVVLGSSHGMMLGPAFERIAADRAIPIALFTQGATPSLFASPENTVSAYQSDANEKLRRDEVVRQFIAQWKPAVVIVCGRWDAEFGIWGPPGPHTGFANAFERTVSFLRPHSAHIIVVGQPPLLPVEDDRSPRVLFRRYQRLGNKLPAFTEVPSSARFAAMDFLKSAAQIELLDLDPLFINKDGTISYCDESGVFYSDEDHLSEYGAMKARPALESHLLRFDPQAVSNTR